MYGYGVGAWLESEVGLGDGGLFFSGKGGKDLVGEGEGRMGGGAGVGYAWVVRDGILGDGKGRREGCVRG